MDDGPEAVLAALDPEQCEVALATRGPVCVIAGAGTGKTRAIAHRVAYAVRTGVVSPGHVLAVTFTTRAASASRGIFESSTAGGRPPTVTGQKWTSCRNAAEWNVRAVTWSSPEPPGPSSWRSRPRSSPAARVVNVTASTWPGLTTPVRTA